MSPQLRAFVFRQATPLSTRDIAISRGLYFHKTSQPRSLERIKKFQDCGFARGSELYPVNPGSAGPKFGERTRYNSGLEFGENPFISTNSELWQARSSEKGECQTLVKG